MATNYTGYLGGRDVKWWDGITRIFSRRTSTGGTVDMNMIGYSVDVLEVYGDGTDYSATSLNSAISAIGTTRKVSLVLQPGTWTIGANVTVSSNITLVVPSGAMITKSGTSTFTVNGPFKAGLYQVFSGFSAGDVTFGARSVKEVYPEWWGAIAGDGVDDDSSVFNATASVSSTGGTLKFHNGQYDISAQWVLSSSSNATHDRKPLRIVGAGADWVGMGGVFVPTGGTILNLKYSLGPKISSTSQGHVEITGINLYNTGTDTQAFVYSEGTVMHVHHNAFWGGTNKNDGVVLGGTTDVTGFQGYGTVIRTNFFNRISRAAYLRRWANAVVIRDNSIFLTGGGDAAIELDGISPQSIAGNVITGNLIEMTNYTYGIKLTNASNNYFSGNGFFDGASPSSAYYADAGSTYNTFIEGMTGGASLTFLTENGASVGTNTVIRNQQAARSSMGSGTLDFHTYPNVQLFGGYGPTIYSGAANTTWRQRYRAFDSGGTYYLENHFVNGAGDTIAYGPSVKVYPNGSWVNATTDFEELVGTLRIKTPAGQALELWGDTIRLKDSAGNVNSVESMPYSTGTWTPTPNNLTVVGTPTYTGTYTKIGNVVHLVLEITSTTSTASTVSSTYFTGIPFSAAKPTTVVAGSLTSGAGYGTGVMNIAGDIYLPTWTADASVVVSLTYMAV